MQHHSDFREFTWVAPRRNANLRVNAIGAVQRAHFDAGVVPNATPFESAAASTAETASPAGEVSHVPAVDEG